MPTNHNLNDKQRRIAFSTLLVGAAIGLAASVMLSYEALVIAKDSSANLSCDINAVFSCGAVARHWSAYVLGAIPNSFIGMVAYPVFITVAVAGLAKVKFPQWFMRAALAGAIVSILFAAWMFYMSYTAIGVLCPWCLTTDIGTLLVLFALVRYNSLAGNLGTGNIGAHMRQASEKNYDIVATISFVVLVLVSIIVKFGAGLF